MGDERNSGECNDGVYECCAAERNGLLELWKEGGGGGTAVLTKVSAVLSGEVEVAAISWCALT